MKNSRRPRILFIHEEFGRISEVFVHRMITSMKEFDVYLLTGSYINKEHFPFPEERIIYWDRKEITIKDKVFPYINRKFMTTGRYSSLHSVILRKICEIDVDIVCFQFGFLPVQLGKDLKKLNKPFCIIHHGTDVNRAFEDRLYAKKILEVWKYADKIFFVSEFLKKRAEELGAPKNKSIVHYLGVPLGVKPSFQKPDKPFRFICVARFVPVKNHLILLRAFSDVLKKTHPLHPELILVGGGELEEDIHREISRLGLEETVLTTGALDNKSVFKYLSKSDAIILVSRIYSIKGKMRQEEGLPISLLEGAAAGLPMIGSRTGGIPEIIEDRKNGYLVDPDNPDEIALAMLKIMNETVLRREMGVNARRTVENKFSFDRQMDKFESIISVMIGKKKCH